MNRRRLTRAKRGAVPAALAALAAVLLWRLWPVPTDALAVYPASLHLLDRDGRPLRITLGPRDVRCDPVPPSAAGDWAAKAIVAAEDKRFFRHPGVDAIAMARAAAQNLWRRRVVSGASTLSTQVVRLIAPRPRTLPTKIVEALTALKMERRMTKAEILGQYLNRAPFGGNLVGVQAASRQYFGKDARDLTLAEASLLMGLPQSPARLRPDRHAGEALTRRDYVLQRMVAAGFITQAQQHAAQAQPAPLRPSPTPFVAPHFCELVLATRAGRFDRGGTDARLRNAIRTTLDSRLQQLAEDELRRRSAGLRERGVYGGAVVILDVASGAVRALVGSPDYNDTNHAGRVNGAWAARSPGSLLKPFACAMAFDRGLCTPETVVADVPIQFRDYRPEDFTGKFAGLVTIREALVDSLNIPALTVTQQVGLEPFVAQLQRLGLSTVDRPAGHYGISLVLGTVEVRLLDIANAYACLARRGAYAPPRLLEDEPQTPPVSVFSPEAAYLVADVLSGDERAAAVTGHAADARLPRVAWKTGTSSGCRDAWTVAYNPEFVVGVWLGNPDGAPAPELVGVEAAAPLAYAVFRGLYPDGAAPWYERPAGLRTRKVCAVSGQPPNPWCAALVDAVEIAGVTDPQPCRVHRRCADERIAAVWPPVVADGLRQLGVATGQAGLPRAASPTGRLRITCPQPDTVFRRIEGFRGELQTLDLAAVAPEQDGTLFWFVDGVSLAAAPAGRRVPWPIAAGPHIILCCDSSGRADRVRITVE